MKSLMFGLLTFVFTVSASATTLDVVSIWKKGNAFIQEMVDQGRIERRLSNPRICFDVKGDLQLIYSEDFRSSGAYGVLSKQRDVVRINPRRLDIKVTGVGGEYGGLMDGVTEFSIHSKLVGPLNCVRSTISFE